MFVGHYSAAFLAKRVAPGIPLPAYFVACQIVDLFWGIFVLLGIEKVRHVDHITASNSLDLYFMPFTHGLPAAVIWACSSAGLYWILARPTPQRTRNALLFGAVVISHWVFDFLVHRPDLPLWYDSFKVGLGLWNFRILELLLELVLLWTSLILVLEVIGENRRRFIVLGFVMTAFQIASVVLPTPAHDYQIAWQLLGSYACLTVLSYFTDRTPVHASRD